MKPSKDIINYELLKKGSPSALSEIHTMYSKSIYWIGRSLIEDSFVVETLVQDTFLKLWVNRDSIESPKHIFNFLRYVMTRECNHFYARPRNRFLRDVHSLEHFGNYQDYMAGFDPKDDIEHLDAQTSQQSDLERMQKVLSVLVPERRRLIELCLKYGFRYKEISKVMGKSTTETSREVKLAILDIKTIIDQGKVLDVKIRTAVGLKVQGSVTGEQARILELRCEKRYSFAVIAKELGLSQKEVHSEFMVAYRSLQDKHQQELRSA
jgi:RNA polymerase sigma factor (sigma-70 family)